LVRAREPAGSTPAGFSFAIVGRDPLMLLLPFKAMLFSRPEKLAAHRRSNLLSRSRGISHITKAPGLLSPPVKGLNARGPLKVHPKYRLKESALAHHAIEGIDRHMAAGSRLPHQRASTAGFQESWSCRVESLRSGTSMRGRQLMGWMAP
jgi:hypothetical protein